MKPRLAALIVEAAGKMKKGGSDNEDKKEKASDDDEDNTSTAMESAGEDLHEALESGDGKEIAKAFKRLMEICND